MQAVLKAQINKTDCNDARGIAHFGLKVGMVGKARFEARIQELVENFPDLMVLVGLQAPRAPSAISTAYGDVSHSRRLR